MMLRHCIYLELLLLLLLLTQVICVNDVMTLYLSRVVVVVVVDTGYLCE